MISKSTIRIDIKNNPEILQCICDTVPFMDGWILQLNVHPGNIHWDNLPNKTARFFSFSPDEKDVAWCYGDNNGDGNEREIRSIADISLFLDEVFVLGEKKIKPKLTIEAKEQLNEIYGKLIKENIEKYINTPDTLTTFLSTDKINSEYTNYGYKNDGISLPNI